MTKQDSTRTLPRAKSVTKSVMAGVALVLATVVFIAFVYFLREGFNAASGAIL